MSITRRDLGTAATLALALASLPMIAHAESADEAAVKKAIDDLTKAMKAADKAALEALVSDQLSYGHSSGKVQSKAEFVDGVMTSKAVTKSIAFPELTVGVVGDTAIARHLFEAEMETDGKTNNVKIGALQVWQKQGGNWKLLARQGFKLA